MGTAAHDKTEGRPTPQIRGRYDPKELSHAYHTSHSQEKKSETGGLRSSSRARRNRGENSLARVNG